MVVSLIHSVRNNEVHGRAGIEMKLASKVDQRELKWS